MGPGSPSRPPRLFWLAMLSLDAPLFVVLARELAWPGAMTAHPADALFVGWLAWAGYALDRWVDARAGGPGTDTWRHRFHREHARGFLLVALAVLAVAVVLAVRAAGDDGFLAARWRWRAELLGAGLALVLVHRWVPLAWAVRAALVSAFLAAMTVARWGEIDPRAFAPVLLMVAANLAVIRRSEHPEEKPWLGWVAPAACLVGLVCAGLLAMDRQPIAFAAVWGGFGLWVVDQQRARCSPEGLRARADLVLLLALAVAWGMARTQSLLG